MASGDVGGSSKRLTIAFIGAKSVGKTSIIRVSWIWYIGYIFRIKSRQVLYRLIDTLFKIDPD